MEVDEKTNDSAAVDSADVAGPAMENEDTCSTTSSSTSSASSDVDPDDDEVDSGGFEKRLPLEPFKHQVGGHFPMVCLDQETVCKPINDREHRIYLSMPEQLSPFVPKFHGVMKVDLKEAGNGFVTLRSLPPPGYNPKIKSGSNKANPDDEFCNPWALKCHRDHLKKLGLDVKGQITKYLLLENVVHDYERPCVLDLKMGKRQFSDNVSQEKAKRKIAKSNQTTSSSLGLRLCGMQVFRDGKYECLDKYDGRALQDQGFKETIRRFLRPNSIPKLLTELEKLKAVIVALDSYRFYTSSVLVTYDAVRSDDVDVRMIDFAHSTHRRFRDPVVYEGPDEGFIQGLTNLVNMLKRFESL